MNVLLIPFILVAVFLFATAGFALWAFNGREDYRLNVESKVSEAVTKAVKEEGIKKDKAHAEADKSPVRVYSGPDQYGALRIPFPKTWSGYVADKGNVAIPVDGYFHPAIVPNIADQGQAFALRVKVTNSSYVQTLGGYTNQVASGKLKARAYSFPKVPGIIGTRFEGLIRLNGSVTGTLIIVPLRDKTLSVWTEVPSLLTDVETYTFNELTFSP
jgi:hypothetical protein